MQLEFTGEIWHWAGPAPFYFVTVPEEACRALRAASGVVSYGWGMIPVVARIGTTTFKTSLFPKNGGYVVPVKASVRGSERLVEGSVVCVLLDVRV